MFHTFIECTCCSWLMNINYTSRTITHASIKFDLRRSALNSSFATSSHCVQWGSEDKLTLKVDCRSRRRLSVSATDSHARHKTQKCSELSPVSVSQTRHSCREMRAIYSRVVLTSGYSLTLARFWTENPDQCYFSCDFLVIVIVKVIIFQVFQLQLQLFWISLQTPRDWYRIIFSILQSQSKLQSNT